MECTWVGPVLSTYVATVLSATAVDDYTKDTRKVSYSFEVRRGGTYINPITAVTFSIEKTYSASPYTLTLKKLIETMIPRKIVIAAQGGIGEFQYSSVIAADMTSRGIVTAHCRA